MCHAFHIFIIKDILKFVLLKCIYTSLAHCNACLILEKHVRVLFEGNILLTAWLQDPLISSP